MNHTHTPLFLTENQQKYYREIQNFIEKNSRPPSLKELSLILGVSIPAAHKAVKMLTLKGYLSKAHNSPRSLVLKDTKSPHNLTVSLPIMGIVSAGYGISLFEEYEPNSIEVPRSMLRGNNIHYALRVSGSSMEDAGILNNDIIIIEQSSAAENGDTVIAAIKSEYEEKATIKKIRKHGNLIDLIPQNQAYETKTYPASQIEIRGKYLGLIRLT